MKRTYITPATEMVKSEVTTLLAGSIDIKGEYNDGLTTCAPANNPLFDDSNENEEE